MGSLLLAGLTIHTIGQRTRLPRVTLLLILGVVVGPLALDALPRDREEWLLPLGDVALVMIGFLLGGEFTTGKLREMGALVLSISLAVSFATAGIVLAGAVAAGASMEVALLLGAIATATDPAATIAVIQETRARGRFARVLEGVVAIDDVWGLLTFSVLFAGRDGAGRAGGCARRGGGWRAGDLRRAGTGRPPRRAAGAAHGPGPSRRTLQFSPVAGHARVPWPA